MEQASDALKRSVPPASDIGALVDIALTFRGRKIGIASNQKREEVEGLLNIISSAKPRAILEIGRTPLRAFLRTTTPEAVYFKAILCAASR